MLHSVTRAIDKTYVPDSELIAAEVSKVIITQVRFEIIIIIT